MMQHGCRVFQTDHAVLCSDWVPNESIICVFNAQLRDFYHINRGYPACRKKYNEKIREHKEEEPVFVESQLTTLNAMVDTNFDYFASEFGRGTLRSFPNTRREVTDIFKESEARHGVNQEHVQGYMRAPFMGVSYVPQLRDKASRKGLVPYVLQPHKDVLYTNSSCYNMGFSVILMIQLNFRYQNM